MHVLRLSRNTIYEDGDPSDDCCTRTAEGGQGARRRCACGASLRLTVNRSVCWVKGNLADGCVHAEEPPLQENNALVGALADKR